MAALRKKGGGNKEAALARGQVVVVVVECGGGLTTPDQTRLLFHDGWRMFKEDGWGLGGARWMAAAEMNKKVED